MKKTFLKTSILLLVICLASCKQAPDEMLENLTGYWEIEQVKTEGGDIKEYNISTVIDFIEITKDKGLRTKVKPQLDGSYINNGATEPFEIDQSDEKLVLNYNTSFAQWNEEVLKATTTSLVVKNEDGKIFHYKRFEGFRF